MNLTGKNAICHSRMKRDEWTSLLLEVLKTGESGTLVVSGVFAEEEACAFGRIIWLREFWIDYTSSTPTAECYDLYSRHANDRLHAPPSSSELSPA